MKRKTLLFFVLGFLLFGLLTGCIIKEDDEYEDEYTLTVVNKSSNTINIRVFSYYDYYATEYTVYDTFEDWGGEGVGYLSGWEYWYYEIDERERIYPEEDYKFSFFLMKAKAKETDTYFSNMVYTRLEREFLITISASNGSYYTYYFNTKGGNNKTIYCDNNKVWEYY